jgi:hypothetical protein
MSGAGADGDKHASASSSSSAQQQQQQQQQPRGAAATGTIAGPSSGPSSQAEQQRSLASVLERLRVGGRGTKKEVKPKYAFWETQPVMQFSAGGQDEQVCVGCRVPPRVTHTQPRHPHRQQFWVVVCTTVSVAAGSSMRRKRAAQPCS